MQDSINHLEEDWANALLELAEKDPEAYNYDGVLLMKRVQNEKTKKEENVFFLLEKNQPPKRLEGSNLQKELKNKKIFKLYGPSQTTGSDLKLDENAHMLVSIGEDTTLWPLIQSIMRMREFLKPDETTSAEIGQKMTWVYPEDLEKMIVEILSELKYTGNLAEIGPEEFFTWALTQEAKRQESVVEMRAYQEIKFVLQQSVERQMKGKSMQDKAKIFKEHAALFGETKLRDNKDTYGGSQQMKPTDQVLNGYITQLKEKGNVPERWLTPQDNDRIATIVKEASNQVEQIKTKANNLFAEAEVQAERKQKQEQKQEVKAEQEMEQMVASRRELRPLPIQSPRDLGLPLEDLRLTEKYQANSYFTENIIIQEKRPTPVMYRTNTGQKVETHISKKISAPFTNLFSSHLFISPNCKLATESSRNTQHLSPISYLLVIEDTFQGKTTRRYLACSESDAEYYKERMLDSKYRDAVPSHRNFTLVTVGKNPVVVQTDSLRKGKGERLRIHNEIFNSEEFSKVLTDVGIINGKVYKPQMMKRMFKDFGIAQFKLCQRFWNLHAFQDGLEKQAFTDLWEEFKDVSPQMTDHELFISSDVRDKDAERAKIKERMLVVEMNSQQKLKYPSADWESFDNALAESTSPSKAAAEPVEQPPAKAEIHFVKFADKTRPVAAVQPVAAAQPVVAAASKMDNQAQAPKPPPKDEPKVKRGKTDAPKVKLSRWNRFLQMIKKWFS